MTKTDDFLIAIHAEELPPKSLLSLGQAFHDHLCAQLTKMGLNFSGSNFFASPRHLAVLIQGLDPQQADQLISRKGPALKAAFDANGEPSKACMGFANSVGVAPKDLQTIKTEQGEWVSYEQKVAGKAVSELAPLAVNAALLSLPIKKRMRWGACAEEFVRPVHAVIMLYGDQVIPATILGINTNRSTRGHHFFAPDWITIPHAAAYESLMETEGRVVVNFAKRKKMITEQIEKQINKKQLAEAQVILSEDLLQEVTGLVEWPTVYIGEFDTRFLSVPKEVLISAMQDHQRYFPLIKDEKLQPYFVMVSNVHPANPSKILAGNERVLRARLQDAAFFYQSDQKEKLPERIDRLKGILFQAKLGTLYDKSKRIANLAELLASPDSKAFAKRAGLLAKADLTTLMVGEFPELQGLMGYYYALIAGEPAEVAEAIKAHYYPRFADDVLPTTPVGIALALADRIDTLVGAFGIHQIPTGDKDPYGLRRQAIGVLRILIENKIDIDLKSVITFALSQYNVPLENKNAVAELLNFMQERLRAWYQEKQITPDVFAAVSALALHNPYDIDRRIQAVETFKALKEAEKLSIANKRVSNILAKYSEQMAAHEIEPAFFENASEKNLAEALRSKEAAITALYEARAYDKVLLSLAELREPVDDFFDHVMVMTEDKKRRENRILLLKDLRNLFLKIADIALLHQGAS